MDVPGLDQFYHRYFAQQSAHMRVHLMSPIFNYNTVLPRVPVQESVTVMNGIKHSRHLPSWTAVARMIIEIDINPCEFDAVEEMTHKADIVGRHCLLSLIHDLLQPHDAEYDCIEQSCLHILGATMHEHSDVFRQFVGAFKFRCTLSPMPIVFAEFQAECRRHEAPLSYVVVDEADSSVDDDAHYGALPSRLPPALVLSLRQVPCVCAALWTRFAVVLVERAPSVTPLAPRQHGPPRELSATLPFIDELTSGSEHDGTEVHADDLVSGGGTGSQKRRKVKEPLPSPPPSPGGSIYSGNGDDLVHPAVFWPVWSLPFDEATVQIHVTVGHAVPVDVDVPSTWSRSEIERAFAAHVAAKHEWIDFTWIDSDVCLEYSMQYPHLDSVEGQALRAQFFAMPAMQGHRRSLTSSYETILGHQATHGRGLTSYTHAHLDAVRILVSCVTTFLPSAVFNAVALVRHASTQVHIDRMNDSMSDMIVVPQDVPEDAWFWIESSTGSSAVQMDEQPVFGAWFPYNRILCFSSAMAHQVQAQSLCSSIVLYRTERVPWRVHVKQLVDLDFPLSVAELASLDDLTGSGSDTAAADTAAAELDNVAVSHSGDEHVQVDGTDAQDCDQSNPVAATETLTMLKTKPDGRLRTLHLRVPVGSNVSFAVRKLKRFLKLNPAKIQICHHCDGVLAEAEALPFRHVLSPADGPYFVRIISVPVEPRSCSEPPSKRRATAVGAPVSDIRPVIGAPPCRRSEVSSPPVGQHRAASSAGAACDPQPPKPAVPSSAMPVAADVADLGRTPFERWVTTKLLTLEARQLELMIAVRDLADQTANAASGGPHTEESAPPWHRSSRGPNNDDRDLHRDHGPARAASAVSRFNFVHGAGQASSPSVCSAGSQAFVLIVGGAKFHRIQHDAVAKVALSLLVKDLLGCPLQCDVKLLQHVCWNDRKCTLACFQSRCRLQRLRSLAAAFRRIGLLQYHELLVKYADRLGKEPKPQSPADAPLSPLRPQSQSATPVCPESPVPDPVRADAARCYQGTLDARADHLAQLIEEVHSRVTALEVWAHALDGSSQHGSADVITSIGKANEIIEQLAHAAVSKYAQDLAAPSDDTYAALAMHIDEKIDAAVASSATSPQQQDSNGARVPLAAARRVAQPGDGLCLFHSLAAGLADGTTALSLQQEILEYIRSNKSLQVAGVPLKDWQILESTVHTATTAGVDDQPPGHWGGAVEIAAFAASRNVRVRVFQPLQTSVRGYECVATFG
eukprot:6491904-Amphidinium_carterae.1